MDNPMDGTSGKLGHGVMLADELKGIDIGPGDIKGNLKIVLLNEMPPSYRCM